jgi:hypothetical protein
MASGKWWDAAKARRLHLPVKEFIPEDTEKMMAPYGSILDLI